MNYMNHIQKTLIILFILSLSIVLAWKTNYLVILTRESPILFPLSDPGGKYVIDVENTGAYLIQYTPYNSSSKSAYIGSSQVSLDQYRGKSVRIVGEFSPVYKKPLCRTTCRFSKMYPTVEIVDISESN